MEFKRHFLNQASWCIGYPLPPTYYRLRSLQRLRRNSEGATPGGDAEEPWNAKGAPTLWDEHLNSMVQRRYVWLRCTQTTRLFVGCQGQFFVGEILRVQSVRRRREEDREHYMPLDGLSSRKSCPAKVTRENPGNQGPCQALPNYGLYNYSILLVMVPTLSTFDWAHHHHIRIFLVDVPGWWPRSSLLKIQTWGRVDALSWGIAEMGRYASGSIAIHTIFRGMNRWTSSEIRLDSRLKGNAPRMIQALGFPFKLPFWGCGISHFWYFWANSYIDAVVVRIYAW